MVFKNWSLVFLTLNIAWTLDAKIKISCLPLWTEMCLTRVIWLSASLWKLKIILECRRWSNLDTIMEGEGRLTMVNIEIIKQWKKLWWPGQGAGVLYTRSVGYPNNLRLSNIVTELSSNFFTKEKLKSWPQMIWWNIFCWCSILDRNLHKYWHFLYSDCFRVSLTVGKRLSLCWWCFLTESYQQPDVW